MSQRNPKLIDMDFAQGKERRIGPASSNASGSLEGATGEIRALMDQLQQTALEARHRLRAVEDERDTLAEQMDALQGQARELRDRLAEEDSQTQQTARLQQQCKDLEQQLQRAQGLAAERDAALREQQRQGRSTPDLQPRLAAAEQRERELRRQQEEIVRHRDELARSVEALNRTVQNLNGQVVNGQTQLLSLRQARDGAQNQTRDLVARLESQDDQIAELQYQLDQAAASPATAEPPNESWLAERELLCRQVTELHAKCEALPALAPPPAVGEVQELSAARDAAIAEVTALQAQVERLRQQGEQPGAPNAETLETFRRDRDAARVQVQISMREVMELRAQLEKRQEENARNEGQLTALLDAADELRGRFTPLAQEREAAVKTREEALTSLAAAQKQIERIVRERDLLRESGTEQTLLLERQADELRGQIEALRRAAERPSAREENQFTALGELQREKRELSSRLEAQRLETIELVTRLQEAQEQVRMLGASLAEARLLAKAAGAPAPTRHRAADVIIPFTPFGTQAPEAPSGALAPAVTPPLSVPAVHDPFPGTDTHSIVRAMRRCYNAYAKDPDDLSHLNELHCAAHTLAEQAREGGCVAVQRIAVALATLMQELYHFPEQITSEVLTSIVQTIEFLTALLKLKELRHLRDPSTGVVCVIDDDAATRECIIMALETVMVQTVNFPEATEALCGLATTHCDLIVLDVQMPGMDGFELCTEIRQGTKHRHTPVLFVTGQSGPEVRARCALCGGNDFLMKPFILAELGLKALMIMVRSELHLAM